MHFHLSDNICRKYNVSNIHEYLKIIFKKNIDTVIQNIWYFVN